MTKALKAYMASFVGVFIYRSTIPIKKENKNTTFYQSISEIMVLGHNNQKAYFTYTHKIKFK